MFTVCNNQNHDECVYNLIKRPQMGSSKPPMYTSRYACMVRKESFCNKRGCSKTMGPPIVPLCPPEKYLRKHSRAPISIRPPGVPRVQLCPIPVKTEEDLRDVDVEVRIQNGQVEAQVVEPCAGGDGGNQQAQASTSRGECRESPQDAAGLNDESSNEVFATCTGAQLSDNNNSNQAVCGTEKPCSCSNGAGGDIVCVKCRVPRLCCNDCKPPVPSAACGRFGIIPKGRRDYVRDNAIQAIRQPAKIPCARFVDQPKGTSQEWTKSGFARKYVFRHDYGLVPGYLVQRKQELQAKAQQERYASEQAKRDAQEKCRHLDENERQSLICGLKMHWEQVFAEFQSLPLLIDTAGKIKRKAELEEQLKDIEKDLQLLNRHNHIFVGDANKSFYLA